MLFGTLPPLSGPAHPPGGHLDEDVCLELLHGLLTEAEQRAAVEHLLRCSACEDLLRREAATRERLRASVPLGLGTDASPETTTAADRGGPLAPDQKLTRSGGAEPNLSTTPRRAPRSPERPWWTRRPVWGLAVAAASVAAIAVIVIPRPETPPSSLAPPWLPSATDMLTQRGQSEGETPLVAGLRAYETRDLDEAIRLLGSAPEPDRSLEAMRRAYLGNALVARQRFDEAAAVLAPMEIAYVPQPWAGESRWALYLAWRCAGEKRRADSLIKVLAGEPGDVGQRARGIRR